MINVLQYVLPAGMVSWLVWASFSAYLTEVRPCQLREDTVWVTAARRYMAHDGAHTRHHLLTPAA